MRNAGIKQGELATHLGMHQSVLSRYVAAGRVPEWQILTKIADRLNVTCDWLLRGEESPAAQGYRVAEPAPEPMVERQFTANSMRAMNLALGRPINEHLPPEMAEAELIILEFNAWLRRTALKTPEAMALVAPRIRILINEVEEHAASPPEAGATGPAGQQRASNNS